MRNGLVPELRQEQRLQRRFVDLAGRRVGNVLERRDDYPARRELESTHALSGCALKLIDIRCSWSFSKHSSANSRHAVDGDVDVLGACRAESGRRLRASVADYVCVNRFSGR